MDSIIKQTSQDHVFVSKHEKTPPKVVDSGKLPSCEGDVKEDTTIDLSLDDTISVPAFVFKPEENVAKVVESKKISPLLSHESEDDCFRDDDDESKENKCATHSRQIFDAQLWVISSIVFVVSTSIYVAMETTYLPYYQFYRDTPWHIREAEDDVVWWDYYNESGSLPDHVLNATDDYTLMEWFNNSFLDEEQELGEFLFQVPNAESKYENVDEAAAWVSQYMMLYFCAALGFFISGVLDLYISRGKLWSMILSGVMILAAAFGIVSAMMVNKDAWISTILNTVSVHLFALEAVSMIISRHRLLKATKHDFMKNVQNQNQSDGLNPLDATCLSIPTVYWLFLGDACFLIGTSGDVVLSYFYILEQDYLEHAAAAIVTATFWLLSALLYLSVNLFKLIKVKQYHKNNGLHQNSSDVRKLQLIVILLVVVAVAVVTLGTVFGLDSSVDESFIVESEEGTFAPTYVSTANATDFGSGSMTEFSTEDIAMLMENCTKSMFTFSENTVVLTMTVVSTVTAVEVQYAAKVFSETYQAMLLNALEHSNKSYCDPFCREINRVVVVETGTSDMNEGMTSTEASSTQCNVELQLTLKVEGTYWACEDILFPGLFSRNGPNSNPVDPGVRLLVEESSCPACPNNPMGQGLTAPSESSVLEAMKRYVTVLPSLCDLLSIDTLDTGF